MTSRVSPTPDGRYWLLWDGECDFCRWSVGWVRRWDRSGAIRTVPFQEAPTPPLTPELRRACGRAIQLIGPDGRVTRAGRAALDVLGLLGFRRTAAVLALPPLVWLVESGYRIVADHRPFFGRFVPRAK